MKLRIILIIVLLIGAVNAIANYLDYHKILNEAKYYTDSKLKKVEMFEKAFELNTPFAKDAYTLAKYYIDLKKNYQAKKWLKKSIELGKQFFPDSKYFEEFTSKYYHEIDYLSPIDSTDKKNDFILNYLGEKYESLRSDFIENCNKTLHYEQLLFAENYFQESRGYYFDHNSDTLGYYCSYKYSYMVNSNFFLELLENESFPERRKTRRFNSNSISMLLNHVIAGFNQHEEKALRLLDLAYELVLNGELTPWEYASSYDHYATYFPPRKSIYGARFHLSENNEPCVNELLYPDKVDSLRKAIGLIPLKEWCENFNYQLPFNYEK